MIFVKRLPLSRNFSLKIESLIFWKRYDMCNAYQSLVILASWTNRIALIKFLNVINLGSKLSNRSFCNFRKEPLLIPIIPEILLWGITYSMEILWLFLHRLALTIRNGRTNVWKLKQNSPCQSVYHYCTFLFNGASTQDNYRSISWSVRESIRCNQWKTRAVIIVIIIILDFNKHISNNIKNAIK